MNGGSYQELGFLRELITSILELEYKTLLANTYKLIILEGCWKKRFHSRVIPSEIIILMSNQSLLNNIVTYATLLDYLQLKQLELDVYVISDSSLIAGCIHEILVLQDAIIQKVIKLYYENI